MGEETDTTPLPDAPDPEPGSPQHREALERLAAFAARHGEVLDLAELADHRLAAVRKHVLDRCAGPFRLS